MISDVTVVAYMMKKYFIEENKRLKLKKYSIRLILSIILTFFLLHKKCHSTILIQFLLIFQFNINYKMY